MIIQRQPSTRPAIAKPWNSQVRRSLLGRGSSSE
jgi:hypothetical protein